MLVTFCSVVLDSFFLISCISRLFSAVVSMCFICTKLCLHLVFVHESLRGFRRACTAGRAGPSCGLASEGGLGWVCELLGTGSQGLPRVGESSASQVNGDSDLVLGCTCQLWGGGGQNKGTMGSAGTLSQRELPLWPSP